jgi:hypothetical protein
LGELAVISNVLTEVDPHVSVIAREMQALRAALEVADGRGDPQEAKLLGKRYLSYLTPGSLEELVIEVALRHVLDLPVERGTFNPCKEEGKALIVEAAAALSWLAWASGDSRRARTLLQRLVEAKTSPFSSEQDALHLLTLLFWGQATLLLIEADLLDARSFFRRALELGSRYGTASHPMISWAYAGSFFKEGAHLTS